MDRTNRSDATDAADRTCRASANREPRTDGGAAGAADHDSVALDAAWSPTRLSTGLVLVMVVALALALAVRVGATVSAAVAAVDAALFGASLWLIGRERWQALTRPVAGIAALFVGGGFVLAVGYTSLSTIASVYPVENPALIAPRGLTVVSSTMVVVGSTVAMVGAAAAVGNLLTEETVNEYSNVVGRVFLVPGVLGVALLGSALLSNLGDASGTGPVAAVEELLGGLVGALVSPVPGEVHLLTFALVLAVSADLLREAVELSPISELATGAGDGDGDLDLEATERRVRRWLRGTALAALAATPVGLAVAVLPASTVRQFLPDPLVGLLVALTANGPLRRLLVGIALVAGVVVLAVRAVRRVARADTRETLQGLVPVGAGVVVVVVVVPVHEPLLTAGIGFVAERLPGVFAEAFQRQSGAALEYYGSLAVALALAAFLVLLSAATAGWLYVAMRMGYLPGEMAAPALASAGLFTAAAFAGAGGVAPPLVVAGVVGSLLAWDLGEFGVTLGREVGRRAHTRGTELVHAGASLGVGLLGALATGGLLLLATRQTVTELTTVPFAVVGVVVGLVLLFAALR